MPQMHPSQSPVRAIREAADLEKDEFADKIGVDVRTIYRWESTDRLPKGKAYIRVLRQIAKKHNIELNTL